MLTETKETPVTPPKSGFAPAMTGPCAGPDGGTFPRKAGICISPLYLTICHPISITLPVSYVQ